MNNKELTWEEVRANLKLTEEEEEEIRKEEEIIEAVIASRKEKKLTQKQLGELSGIKQPAIARIENHANSPQIDTLIKILNSLGYTIQIVPIQKDKNR